MQENYLASRFQKVSVYNKCQQVPLALMEEHGSQAVNISKLQQSISGHQNFKLNIILGYGAH